MSDKSNLLNNSVNENIRDVFAMTFELYKIAEKNNNIYKYPDQDIPKKLIELYFLEVKPDYNKMLYNFKQKYIQNEAKVEKNDTKLERSGIALMYDYIQQFDPKKDDFNIFITGLKLHQLLYKPLDDARRENIDKEYAETQKLVEIAKKEKNIVKYKEAKKRLEELSTSIQSFGGKLRDDDNQVKLKDVDLKVPSAIDAKVYYNSFVSKEKIEEYNYMLTSYDIFTYINYCVNTMANLIKVQPFNDGNKRTFRGLLNLMFKNRNLPPVYIDAKERNEYKDALFKAILKKDYTDLDNFYYYKICDSIYELDVRPYLEEKNSKGKAKSRKMTVADVRDLKE